MDDLSEQGFTPAFWRTCAALTCVLLTTAFMNVSVFPRFDSVFAYARDLSVLANAATLIVVGLIATFRPSFLSMRGLTGTSIALLVGGGLSLPLGMLTGSAAVLTVSACLLAIGRAWVVVVVGVAASRLTLRQAGVAVALAFVMRYGAATVIWVVPVGVGIALFLLLPLVALVLTKTTARPLFEEARQGEAPADFSATQPSSFLPLASQLFVCLFLFRIAFGYSLRFGEIGGVPISDFLGIVPIAAIALYVLLSGRPLPADLLTGVSVLLVVAGFLIASSSARFALAGSVTLLSAGNAVFDMVAWVVLIAVAGRNVHGAVAAFAWGRGVSGIGTILGAAIGVWSNDLFGSDSDAISFVTGAIILVFVGYALIGLKHFSFSTTIAGVTPIDVATVKTSKQEFEERCGHIAAVYGLSPRELEVFMMLARGRDRAYIQEKLVVSRNTVKAHVKHVYAKLGIHAHQDLIDLVEKESSPAPSEQREH